MYTSVIDLILADGVETNVEDRLRVSYLDLVYIDCVCSVTSRHVRQ